MNDEEFIMTINLSYLIIAIMIHLLFFSTIIFDYKFTFLNRCFKQTNEKTISSGDISSCNEQTCSNIDELSSCSSSLTLDYSFVRKQNLNRTIRSFSLLLCTCSFMTNWLRLGLIYFLPKLSSNPIQSSINFCILQSFFLHVLTLFHLHITICLRLFWHYCFTCERYWQTITYRRLVFLLLFIFICLCLFTLPSLSDEWASIIPDKILQICIVNYTFNYSFTFFILTLTCLIPFIILIISHRQHMKDIENRIYKSVSIDQTINLFQDKIRFQYSSLIVLLWSFLNILLLICLHLPMKDKQSRIIVYYSQLISFLFEPILYIFVFRSLSIITLLRPTNGMYFI